MTLGLAVRLLSALNMAEDMAAVRTVHPRFAVSASSRAHAVDEGSLALLWLEKRIECDRARAVIQAFDQADAEADRETR
jgi:hypothetical protein